MRKVKKNKRKSLLNRIDDSINDKIDEIKEKRANQKRHKKINKKIKIENLENNNNDFLVKEADFDEEINFDENEDEDVLDMKKKKKKSNRKKINIFSFIKSDKKNKKSHENKKRKKEKKKQIIEKKKNKRPFWKKALTFILIIGILGVLSVTAFLGYVVLTAPEFSESSLVSKDQTVIYDINGNIIAKLGTQKRESISYDQLPQVLIDAIIATEDSRFFQHNGVDLFRFIKATIQQVLGHDDAGGASTLTMQTVKNNLTKKGKTNEGKIEKIIRKFQDVYLAVFKVEKKYSKEEILEMYINDNGLGSSYYGVEEASKYYFGKSACDLTLPEAAMIAGLFQAPGRHNPYYDIDSATSRRSIVLKLMERHGYITAEERKMAEKVSIESLLIGRNNSDSEYQGYIDTVVVEVEKLTGDDPATVPMKIYTTMEKSIQDGINSVFASSDSAIWRDDFVQSGVAVINAETGAIAAVGAGRNKTGERQFNYATQAYRQPGSTAKPIFDYGPGIEYNNFSSYTLFMDEPWSYTNGPSIGNWDGGFEGLITARRALQASRNIPALKAFQQVGPKNSQKFAYSLGLDVSLNSSSENYHIVNETTGADNTINEAYSIGGVSKGFTPLNMATAYSCFANGGYYTEPHTVTKIIYRATGEEKEFKYTKEKVMKESTAYIINNILQTAVEGAGFSGGANVRGSKVAAKTGTSNYDEATLKSHNMPYYAINDLWTVAYTSKYAVAVWYGYDEINPEHFNFEDGKKNRLTSAIMAHIPIDSVGWTRPSSVVPVTVEAGTWPAALPSEYTPTNMQITELFVRGTQPTEVSERFKKLNAIKNQKTSKNGNSVTITWDYDMPNVLTKEYIQSYYNKSVFGNSRQRMVDERLNYNSSVLGDVGFAIYKKDGSGNLTLLSFVKDKTYTYNGYGNTTLVIKAEHSGFKSNASNGVEIPITLEKFNEKDIETTFNTSGSIQASVGNYVENGFKSIKYKNEDISNKVTSRYAINTDNDTYATAADFEKIVNLLDAGTYTITYKIYYMDYEIKRTRTLILS